MRNATGSKMARMNDERLHKNYEGKREKDERGRDSNSNRERETAEEEADTVIKIEKKDGNEIREKAKEKETRAMISLEEMKLAGKLTSRRKVQAELKWEEKMNSETRQNYRCKKEWIF